MIQKSVYGIKKVIAYASYKYEFNNYFADTHGTLFRLIYDNEKQ